MGALTETMRCYFDQIVMDLDFAALNADENWELLSFFEEVEREVKERKEKLDVAPKAEEVPDDEEIYEEVPQEPAAPIAVAVEIPPPGPPSPPPPPPGRKVG